MKIRDLKPIIDLYKSESGLIRRWIKANPAMTQLMSLYDENKPDNDINEFARRLLAFHWEEIKNTSRSYLQPRKPKATEMAYIRLAARLDASEQEDKKEHQSSYVKIATLMPKLSDEKIEADVLSFSKQIDFSQPLMMVQDRIFHYSGWMDELRDNLADIRDQTALMRYLFKQYDKASLLQLREGLSKVKISASVATEELDYIKKEVKKLIGSVDYLKELNACVNEKTGGILIAQIPERYFFKTYDHVGLDIRSLFLSHFVNPVTKQPLAANDIEKLKAHPHLGFSVTRFHAVKDIFALPAGNQHPISQQTTNKMKTMEEKSPNLFELDWLNNPSLPEKQKIYAHFADLAELFQHLDTAFINNSSFDVEKETVHTFLNFSNRLTHFKAFVIWSEMDDNIFFSNADLVIQEIKKDMEKENTWCPATENFFAAMNDFSTNTDDLIQKSDGSYIRSNNEYLVRVYRTPMQTDLGIKTAMQDIVKQFKTCFDIAYRYGKLPKLMEAMTPSGICIAEKMRHMVPIFTTIASLGPTNTGLGSLNDLFADIMAQARAVEISRGATWDEDQFLRHILNYHAGKTQYVDKNQVTHTLDEATIRDYLIDIMCYDIVRLNSVKNTI